MEPFDAELLARVQSLHRDIEQKILEVTSLRRSTPVEAAALFQQSCNLPDDAPMEGTVSNPTVNPPIEIPRENEIKDTFTQGVKLLKELKKGVPATSAKLERTRDVVSHVYS
jgi:kinetochor protein Mis14/NSL1